MTSYPLDHCVLPTVSLASARARLEALGFTIAPDAAHPFGTANCCAFFKDGTYLEPLAVADEDAAREARATGNTFVSRDRAFREVCGEEGFSALVVGTNDAASDHARFVDEDISAGPPLSFSRPFIDSSGAREEASFNLAFAAPVSSPSFFFANERVKMPTADRSSLQRHANGVTGIARVFATAAAASAGETFFTRFFRTKPDDTGSWPLSNADVSLLDPAGARRIYGIEAGDDDRLRLRGIVFRATNIETLAERLTIAGVAFAVHEDRLMVPPQLGQGAYFLFEEITA